MTALAFDAAVPAPRSAGVSLTGTCRRLSELLTDHRGRAQWWVDVARHLDDLSDWLRAAADDVDNRRGLQEQIRRDAPHLLGRLRRLEGERDRLGQQAISVRLLTAQYAGDSVAVNAVTRAVHELMWRVRRYQEQSTEMLLDAYARDIGGE